MARPKVVHTLKTILARTDEVGECMEWQGIIAHNTPQIRIDRKLLMVRRVILEMLGKPAKPENYVVASCGNSKCVNPAHILERDKKKHMQEIIKKMNPNSPTRIAKLQKATAHLRVLDDAAVSLILSDNRKGEDLARELGCSKALVNKIRRGDAYRRVSASKNPFAGLMR